MNNDTEHRIARRRLLQAGGVGLIGVSLSGAFKGAVAQTPPKPQSPRTKGQPMPKLENPLPLPPERRLGWAIVGLGSFALNQIIPSIADTQMCKLTALVSGNADKARTVASAYGVPERNIYSYDTFDQIRNNPDVDIVYIILPNALHAQWTIRAAQAGKHVLCEKPMAATVAECQAMIEACDRADRKLMIAYRAQYEPYNLEAIRLVQSGELGKPRVIVADHGRSLDLSRPRDQWRARKDLAGGGSLYDIGIYSLNGTRYLTGEEPTEIRAMMRPGSGDPRVEVEENIQWTMLFPSGVMANCSSSYHYADTNRIIVEGTEAILTMDPATAYYERKMWIRRGDSEEQRLLRDANQFALEMDHLAESVMQNKEPKTPGREGLQDVRLMQLIYEAAETGRPVMVPPLT